jgi:hypothetical protein
VPTGRGRTLFSPPKEHEWVPVLSGKLSDNGPASHLILVSEKKNYFKYFEIFLPSRGMIFLVV